MCSGRNMSLSPNTSMTGILSLATTRSYYLVAPPADQRAMLDRIEAVLAAYPETRAEEILLPYVTESWLALPWTGESG